MEQLVSQERRNISQTADLTMPESFTVTAAVSVGPAPSGVSFVDGLGTFGAFVEQHHVAVGLTGMMLAGLILSFPAMAAMTVKLGPVLAILCWMAGHELAQRQRGAEADVAGSLALVALSATTIAALFG